MVNITQINESTIVITSRIWSIDMPGDIPVFSYIVQQKVIDSDWMDSLVSKQVLVDKLIKSTVTNLSSNREYIFRVVPTVYYNNEIIQGESSSPSGTVELTAPAIAKPQITNLSSVAKGNEQYVSSLLQ